MTFTAEHRKLIDEVTAREYYQLPERYLEAIRALLQAYTMVSEERDRINDVLTKVYAERDELAERVKVLEDALRMTEFGFLHRRCPVCAGFNVGPNGETDKVHTKTCPVAAALSAPATQSEGK